MIKIDNLCKSFGRDEVLKDIHLTIDKGEVLGIIGPSGSGKSTLLRCINNLEFPTSGRFVSMESWPTEMSLGRDFPRPRYLLLAAR